jgi:hypothetical protein
MSRIDQGNESFTEHVAEKANAKASDKRLCQSELPMQVTVNQIEENVCYQETDKHALNASVKIITVKITPKLIVGTKEKQAAKAQDDT